jgi:hypothetical protein
MIAVIALPSWVPLTVLVYSVPFDAGTTAFAIAIFFPYNKILSSTARFLLINSSAVVTVLLVKYTPERPGPIVALEYTLVLPLVLDGVEI